MLDGDIWWREVPAVLKNVNFFISDNSRTRLRYETLGEPAAGACIPCLRTLGNASVTRRSSEPSHPPGYRQTDRERPPSGRLKSESEPAQQCVWTSHHYDKEKALKVMSIKDLNGFCQTVSLNLSRKRSGR